MRVQNDKVYALLKGRSQTEIANQMGCELTNVNYWLNGVRQPRYDRLCQLASVLDVPVDELALILRDIGNERRKQERIASIEKPATPSINFSDKVSPSEVKFCVEISKELGCLTFYAETLTRERKTIEEFISMAKLKYPKKYKTTEHSICKHTNEHRIEMYL